jgi:hypothetical protein
MRSTNRVSGVAVSGLLFSLIIGIACSTEREKDSASGQKVKQETKEALDAARKYAAQKKEQYQREMEAELDSLSRDIQELKAKAEKAGAKTRVEVTKQIAELEKQKEVVSRKLRELQAHSAEAWEGMKAGIDSAIAELKKSYERTASRFKKKESKQ